MLHRLFCLALMLVVTVVTSHVAAQDSATTDAPKIVSITPAIGDQNVDPNLKEIIVIFDKPMRGGRSVTGSGKAFPDLEKIYWKDDKTFVLEVSLFEDHEYHFGLNSPSHRNFRAQNGISLEPVRVNFKTRQGKPGEQVNRMPTEPPKVVSMNIEDGSVNVDPNLKEITITFDQKMHYRGWSVTGSGENFPNITDRIHWKDANTIVIPVKLEANHEYRFGINSVSHKNFRSKYGIPVEPRRVSFKTRDFSGEEVKEFEIAIGSVKIMSAAEQKEAWRKLGELLETQYSYRDKRGISWGRMCESMADDVLGPKVADTVVEQMRWLLAQAQDPHLGIVYQGDRSGTYISVANGNSNMGLIVSQMSEMQSHGRRMTSAKTSDGFGYIAVNSLGGDREAEARNFYQALDAVRDTHAIIIDLRRNGGGDEGLARKIAGCFINGQLAYAKHVSVDPNSETGFTPVGTRYFNENPAVEGYEGKVAVLIGNRCMSSCEALILMMKAAPNVTVMGDRSRGSSGNPHRHDVTDGIQVSLPSWKAMTLDEVCFEEVGVEPDIWVKAETVEFEDGDPVYDAAVMYLKQQMKQ